MKVRRFLLGISMIAIINADGWSQSEKTVISIFSSPDQVSVRLDSLLLGTTPLVDIKIKPGDHLIEALSPFDGIWNTANIKKAFSIKAGRDTTIRINFQQLVKINSIPYHARLIHENRVLGLTPVSLPFEKNRGKAFRIEKKGYHSIEFTLDQSKTRIFNLEPLTSEISEETQSFTQSLFHTRLKSKFLFLTGSVVTHWLAFYFKNVADENYEKYQSTSNPQLIDKYWDRTRKYDRMSEISLGVSYAFLSGLIYTVLWN